MATVPVDESLKRSPSSHAEGVSRKSFSKWTTASLAAALISAEVEAATQSRSNMQSLFGTPRTLRQFPLPSLRKLLKRKLDSRNSTSSDNQHRTKRPQD
ncbi:nicotinamide mononucleotide permease [Fusarium mundagurra]|uniref:Nicotinamide mononucleotide permease n=1 Tax=Fusarium mundagurra TaxID=1567541 RepID=A0A8H6DFJ5_9HYPO|nr:nicotinamide mononucleotide permease [Fusarium mundagurra]